MTGRTLREADQGMVKASDVVQHGLAAVGGDRKLLAAAALQIAQSGFARDGGPCSRHS